MHNLIAIAVLFVSVWKISNGITINCTFGETVYYQPIGRTYRCEAKLLSDGRDVEVLTSVYGIHGSGKSNADVRGIVINCQNLTFIPRNIELYFPNIRVLEFDTNLISNITNDHLIPFPTLERLNLRGNRITTLDNNLFSGLTSLKCIYFLNNTIMHVGHDIDLPNDAATIDFRFNPCINVIADNVNGIGILKSKLEENCPPKIAQIGTDIDSCSNVEINSQVQNVLHTVQSLHQSYNEIKDEVKYLSEMLKKVINRHLLLDKRVTLLESWVFKVNKAMTEK